MQNEILENNSISHIINVENQEKYTIKTDDYKIINCCCIEGLTKMKNENQKVHLTITSPPYYNVKEYVNYANYKEYFIL